MQKQTAFYYVTTWKLCLPQRIGGKPIPTHPPFDPDLMESNGSPPDGNRRQSTVSLIVSPALMKRGNNDGEDFGDCHPVWKARVVEAGSSGAPRSSSRLSNAGHRATASNNHQRGTAVNRSASAMSSTVRKVDGAGSSNSPSPDSKGAVSRPHWRHPGKGP